METVKIVVGRKLTVCKSVALSAGVLFVVLIHLGLFVEDRTIKGVAIVLFALNYGLCALFGISVLLKGRR